MKSTKIFVSALTAMLLGLGAANATDWKSALSGLGSVVKETVAQNTTITVASLEGTWTTSGPAVVLKSDNLLSQVSGSAVTTAVEKKIKPYYKKLGLLNSTMKIASDGSFTLTLKKVPVSGTLTQQSDGSFKMQLLSKLSKLSGKDSSFTVYIQKSGNEIAMTMDAKKLLTLFEAVSSKADLKTLNTITSLLDKYDNICVGYRLTK